MFGIMQRDVAHLRRPKRNPLSVNSAVLAYVSSTNCPMAMAAVSPSGVALEIVAPSALASSADLGQ